MVSKHSIENFIKRAIWRLTRQGSTIKYIPKSIHNGVVIGECAVIRNKMHTFDVYTKNRKPIKKNVCNHKIAICIATIMNQYNGNLQESLIKLNKLDTEYAVALGHYHSLKERSKTAPHLIQEFEEWEEKIYVLSNKIEDVYCNLTL